MSLTEMGTCTYQCVFEVVVAVLVGLLIGSHEMSVSGMRGRVCGVRVGAWRVLKVAAVCVFLFGALCRVVEASVFLCWLYGGVSGGVRVSGSTGEGVDVVMLSSLSGFVERSLALFPVGSVVPVVAPVRGLVERFVGWRSPPPVRTTFLRSVIASLYPFVWSGFVRPGLSTWVSLVSYYSVVGVPVGVGRFYVFQWATVWFVRGIGLVRLLENRLLWGAVGSGMVCSDVCGGCKHRMWALEVCGLYMSSICEFDLLEIFTPGSDAESAGVKYTLALCGDALIDLWVLERDFSREEATRGGMTARKSLLASNANMRRALKKCSFYGELVAGRPGGNLSEGSAGTIFEAIVYVAFLDCADVGEEDVLRKHILALLSDAAGV